MNDKTNPKRATELPATHSESQLSESTGLTIGPYRLLKVIGEGGMGTVYLAQQQTPIFRRVALKIIKPGMDTKQVIARFEAERQALSMMEHPNIAQVLDVGATDAGRPYFVMELIKGLPITQYCDEKRLKLNRRLELFQSICNAVQHAHQKGIIHRDIKPSNVLVAEYAKQAVPKIIDFGLAKALHHQLTDKTMFTQLGQVVGTLEYMSPEQSNMNQLDVDTRTDIYSLGVLLYELLTGTVPFEKKRLREKAFDQVLKIIREEEPPKPSARLSTLDSAAEISANRGIESKRLGFMLRGDLDGIVMKAIDKDRDRRYETANGLAMDVGRFVEGEPVLAVSPSTFYRLKKFVRRNRVATTVSLLVATALLLAVVGTSIGMAWALIEKKRADGQAEIAITAKKNAELASDEAEYSQYISNIPAANSFLEKYSTILARSVLTATPAKHRNFEWALLANRAWPQVHPVDVLSKSTDWKYSNASQFWRPGTPKVIREILPWDVSGGLYGGSFSMDGNSVFFTLANGVVKRFSVSTGEQTGSYSSPTGNSRHVALSPDGTRLAGFTFSNRGSVWDVDSQKIIASRSDDLPKSSPWICQWSPDQKYLVSSHMGGNLQVWNAESLEVIAECAGNEKDALGLYFAPTSDSFWSASVDGTVRHWTLPEGDQLNVSQCPIAKELEYQAFSANGQFMFAMCRDGTHFMWNIATAEITLNFSDAKAEPYLGESRGGCSFSPDDSCVAVITGLTRVTIYDVTSGEVLQEVEARGFPLRGVHLSPDGTRLMTISQDGRSLIWSCFSDSPHRLSQAHNDVVYQIDIDTLGTRLLAGSFDSTATVWDLRQGQCETVYSGHHAEVVAVDLSDDGSTAATLDATGILQVWDASNGKELFHIQPESGEFARHIGRSGGGLKANVLNFPAVMSTGIFSPDGLHVVAFNETNMKVYHSRTGNIEVVLDGATSSGWPIFSHDSSLVAVLEMNAKTAGVWDLNTGELVARLKGQREYLVMMDFSPIDQRLVTCAMEGKVVIWDARAGRQLHVLEDQTGNAVSCRFSTDGRFILVGYADSTVRIWESLTGKLVTTLIGHSDRIRDVRMSSDQTRLLSWAMDNKAIIWDFAQPLANQLLVQGGDSKLLQAHWSPDGKNIFTAWSSGRIEVWSGAAKSDFTKLVDRKGSFKDEFDKWRKRYMNCLLQ